MSTPSKALLILAMLVAASIARSEGIFNPTVRGFSSDGINNVTASSAPTGCASGAIDASAGCPLPMLGI